MTNTTGTTYRRLPSLTGLRFLAAFGVCLGHMNLSPILIPLSQIAVSFFFVLSGFVLTWSARDGDTNTSFWRRRFWKIVPNHVVTWGLMLIVVAVTGLSSAPGVERPGLPRPIVAGANLLLLHSWVPSQEFMFSVNPVSWSLSSEMLFYLLFPLILPLVLRIPAQRLRWAAVAAVALVWLVPVISLTMSGPPLPGGFNLTMAQYWFADYFPVCRLPEFVLGMLLARLVHNGWTPRISFAFPAIASLALFVVVSMFLPYPFAFVAATIIPVGFIVLGAASMDLRGAWSFWRQPWMVFLGEISFAFYLVHYPVIWMFDRIFGFGIRATLGKVGTAVVLTILCAAAAWALYRAVERPLMRRFGAHETAPTAVS